MPYLDPAALRETLAPDGNPAGTAATLDDAQLTAAISEAQGEVDAKLASRYDQVPFTSPPELVVQITAAIAGYLATLIYRRGEPIQPGDPVLLRYQRAQALLTGAANGTVLLPTPDGAPGSSEAATSEAVVVNPTDGTLWTPGDFDLTAGPATLNPSLRWS